MYSLYWYQFYGPTVGLKYLSYPSFSFDETQTVTTLDINEYGDRITYIVIKYSQDQGQSITLVPSLGSNYRRPCNNTDYASRFPQYCTNNEIQTQKFVLSS